jgi:hypothetical protein
MSEALGLIPSTTHTKQKGREREGRGRKGRGRRRRKGRERKTESLT